MERRLIITRDGSHSLFVPELDETYHSRHGAITESMYVYIDHGLKLFPGASALSMLEVGLGTGLNALLTWMNRGNIRIDYTAIEPFPLTESEWGSLNFYPDHGDILKQIHSTPFSSWIDLDTHFKFRKERIRIQDLRPDKKYDLVYYDAFAPSKQPDMWTPEILSFLHHVMNTEALLTTYCASGEVRRMMKTVGFEVEKRKGPPGKKEMLLAWKRGVKP